VPGLKETTLRQLQATTGLSPSGCSIIRSGKRTPHPRLAALAELAANPKIPAAAIRDLAALRWLDAGESVILYGPTSQAVASAKLLVTALRSVLGFLHVQGNLPSPLVGAVPSVARWRLAPLPKALEDAQVTRRLAG
jgi:hypothetical protein